MGRLHPNHPQSYWKELAGVLQRRAERLTSYSHTTVIINNRKSDLDDPEVKAAIHEMSSGFREMADDLDNLTKTKQ